MYAEGRSADVASADVESAETATSGTRDYPPKHSGPASARTGSSSFHDLLESRAAVLGILFFVTGALGLPLLWLSSRFSWPARIFWAVVVTVYTVALIALVVMVLHWSYNQIV